MELTDPKFSIIIVSYNRPKFLVDTINYCMNQTFNAFEVIIIDASNPNLRLSDEFQKKHAPTLKYKTWTEIGNISKQRNAGIKESKGDVIIFLDDDVRFNNELFEKIKNRFSQLNADALSGLIEATHREISKEVFLYKKNPMLYLGQPSFHQNDFLVQTYLISAACFAVKKKALVNIGGFDEQLKGVFDDSDVGIRLSNAGYLVYHDNTFGVFHYAAKGSGSRSPLLGPVWSYANITYIQLKHFYNENPNLFFKKSLIYFLRPSRKYLRPIKLFKEIIYYIKGYKEGLKRKEKGPIYL
jgi:GT2 family glycosyltransferase